MQKALANRDCKFSTHHPEDIIMHPLTGRSLAEREKAIADKDFSSPAFELARNFAATDEVVIARPIGI